MTGWKGNPSLPPCPAPKLLMFLGRVPLVLVSDPDSAELGGSGPIELLALLVRCSFLAFTLSRAVMRTHSSLLPVPSSPYKRGKFQHTKRSSSLIPPSLYIYFRNHTKSKTSKLPSIKFISHKILYFSSMLSCSSSPTMSPKPNPSSVPSVTVVVSGNSLDMF